MEEKVDTKKKRNHIQQPRKQQLVWRNVFMRVRALEVVYSAEGSGFSQHVKEHFILQIITHSAGSNVQRYTMLM